MRDRCYMDSDRWQWLALCYKTFVGLVHLSAWKCASYWLAGYSAGTQERSESMCRGLQRFFHCHRRFEMSTVNRIWSELPNFIWRNEVHNLRHYKIGHTAGGVILTRVGSSEATMEIWELGMCSVGKLGLDDLRHWHLVVACRSAGRHLEVRTKMLVVNIARKQALSVACRQRHWFSQTILIPQSMFRLCLFETRRTENWSLEEVRFRAEIS